MLVGRARGAKRFTYLKGGKKEAQRSRQNNEEFRGESLCS